MAIKRPTAQLGTALYVNGVEVADCLSLQVRQPAPQMVDVTTHSDQWKNFTAIHDPGNLQFTINFEKDPTVAQGFQKMMVDKQLVEVEMAGTKAKGYVTNISTTSGPNQNLTAEIEIQLTEQPQTSIVTLPELNIQPEMEEAPAWLEEGDVP